MIIKNNVTVNKMLLTISICFELIIYYTLGEEVAVFLDKELSSGTYEVEFNSHSGEGRNLTRGFYFYQLRTDGIVETKKMILMK